MAVSIEPRSVTAPSSAVGPWLDNAPVQADWAAPVAPPAPRRLPPGLVYGVVLLSLALIVATIWQLGGFERRTDTRLDRAPGTLLATGPFELTFTEATAQRTTRYDETTYWEVTAIGTGRTTGNTTLAPKYTGSYGMFASRDDVSGEVQVPTATHFGDLELGGRNAFTPGLAPVRFTVTFEYSASYRPAPTVRLGVYQLEFRDTSLLRDGEKTWANGDSFYQLQLPVRVLPDATN